MYVSMYRYLCMWCVIVFPKLMHNSRRNFSCFEYYTKYKVDNYEDTNI